MRAVTLSGPGGPDVMSWTTVADPSPPGPGEIAIDVAASAVNRADLLQRQGFYPPPPGASPILGLECSGRVAAIGADVAEWHVGDAVCALLAGGGYASRVVVPAAHVLPVPSGVSLVAAAGLPEVACTVLSSVFGVGQLADGEVFLCHGGASGIGTFAIQAVRALRPAATIVTTAGSPEKLARCRELGADVAVSYRDEDFVVRVREASGGKGADVILDIMGAAYLARNIDALAADGRIVVIGLQGGVKAELNLAALHAKRGAVHAVALRSRPDGQKADIVAGVREQFWPAIAAGAIRPVVDRVLPIAHVAQAHQTVAASEHVGKVLLTVEP